MVPEGTLMMGQLAMRLITVKTGRFRNVVASMTDTGAVYSWLRGFFILVQRLRTFVFCYNHGAPAIARILCLLYFVFPSTFTQCLISFLCLN